MLIKTVCAIVLALVMVVTLFSPSSSSTPAPPVGSNLPTDEQQNPATVGLQNTNKRVSRFLAEESPAYYQAASHCNKDGEVCLADKYGATGRTTCCKNKCVDLSYDKKNCGECGKKCKYTQTCCQGKCVYLAYDKSHCGACHQKCGKGNHCLYGMCDYA